MNLDTIGATLAGIAGSLLLCGCVATTSPYLDSRFGAAVERNSSLQTRDPEAGANHLSPEGMDGIAAKNAVDRYHNSFRQPPPQQNILSIGIGTGGSAR